MGTKADKHIHKFKRLRYKSGNEVFFCTLPDCRVKMSTALALGKRSICWRCQQPFLMNEYALRLSKPHCDACHVHKNKEKGEEDITLSAPEPMSAFTGDEEADKRDSMSLSERLQHVLHRGQASSTASEAEEEEL